MTAFNAVRFKVKAGREQQFLDAHNEAAFAWPGLRHVNVIKSGEHTFCVIAEWTDMDAMPLAPKLAVFPTQAVALQPLTARLPISTHFNDELRTRTLQYSLPSHGISSRHRAWRHYRSSH
jgi:antibiotic biosynthesis monooxygenase